MKFKNLIAVIVLFAFLATCFPGQLCAVSVEEAGKIESAMPDEAAAVPKKDRKMLVFSLCEGFKHSCVPYWEKVLEVMSEKTGAFECEFSKDMSVFNAQNLKRFDAVCLNNTTHLKFNDEQRKAFMDFIKGGKGLVGIHAATDNFYDWPEAAEMMGGQFTAHPWTAGGTWAVKIDDPDHVLMKPFKGKGFKVKDEIYQTKAPLYSRQKQRVLMSLDMADDATRNVKGFEEGDEDTGITWIKEVGRGRLFYCSLGHNHHLAWEPAVLEHYLRGIQFALGDLAVDTEPIASDAACAAGAKLEGIMKDVSAYDYGQSREALTQLTDLIRDGHDNPAMLKEVEKALTELLRSKASLAAKQFACRQLSIIGTEDSVDTLTLMLRKEDTADMALFAMERIPSSAVDEALRKSGVKVPDTVFLDMNDKTGNIRNAIKDLQYPLVFKPADETSCGGLSIIQNEKQIALGVKKLKQESTSKRFLAQKLVKGKTASACVISGGDKAVALSLNRQLITLAIPDGDSKYFGGEVPLNHRLEQKALKVAEKAVEAVKGLRGHAGVDMLLTDEEAVVIEINPRLTVSYVGLRKVANLNMSEAIIDAVTKGKSPAKPRLKGYSFFSKVEVPCCPQKVHETYKLKDVVSPPFPTQEKQVYALVASASNTIKGAKSKFYRTKKRLLSTCGAD